MNNPEAYIDYTNSKNFSACILNDIPVKIWELAISVCKHVAYLIKNESKIDAYDWFELVPPPVILSEGAYNKILSSKANNVSNVFIDVLVLNKEWTAQIKKISTNNLHLAN